MNGIVYKYGDNIDTDAIIPARCCNILCKNELSKHCFEDLDPSFIKLVKFGDFLAVGENFGCGSSRETAPIAIKFSGISCVIGKSFARIFYRNAINIGLSIIECPSFVVNSNNGDEVELTENKIYNITQNKKYPIVQQNNSITQEIIQQHGLVNYVVNRRSLKK